MNNWLDRTVDLDCGANSCYYRDRTKPSGMRTNGKCHCMDNNPRDTEMFLRRNFHAAGLKIQQLEADLAVHNMLEDKDGKG